MNPALTIRSTYHGDYVSLLCLSLRMNYEQRCPAPLFAGIQCRPTGLFRSCSRTLCYSDR